VITLTPVRWLQPLSWIYGLAVWMRNRAYDARLMPVRSAEVPVISVGNLTAGGTGKTPFVGELVERLERAGCKVGVISRGYGRQSTGPVVVADGERLRTDADEGGDEPVMLAQMHPRTVVVVSSRRHVAARIATRDYGAEVLIMDDGYQHRALHRDLNIMVLDGRNPLWDERLLPAGLRRESLSELRRANALAVSHVASEEEVTSVTEPLRKFLVAADIPLIGFVNEPSGFFRLVGGLPMDCTGGTKVAAFSGIGSHASFMETLLSLELAVAVNKGFGDHHRMTAPEAETLAGFARQAGVERFVTTGKDGARLESHNPVIEILEAVAPICVLRMAVRIVAGESALDSMLDRVLGQRVGLAGSDK